MVQLFFTDESIRRVVERASRELEGPWLEVFNDFLEDIEADVRITSLSTKYSYLVNALLFLKWLQDKGIKPKEVSEKDIKKYIMWLRAERHVSTLGLINHVKTLRRYGQVTGVNTSRLKTPKKTNKTPALPDPTLIEKIIDEVGLLDYKVIIALLYETGARISEILALKGKHVIEEPEGYYKLIIEEPKNMESRTVFVINYSGLLRTYLNIRKPGPEDYLFPSPTRPNNPLHPRNIERVLRRYSKKYGVRIHPHLLRHLRGTLMAKEGYNERIIMKILGHKTHAIVQTYVNLAARDIEEAILPKYGITKRRSNSNIKCPRCGAENPPGARYCWRCGLPLSQASAAERDKAVKELEELLNRLRNLLAQNPELAKQLLTS